MSDPVLVLMLLVMFVIALMVGSLVLLDTFGAAVSAFYSIIDRWR